MNIIKISEIQSKIFEVRGQKVMIDRDLAELYCVETRVLNQAVKRNITRFPEEFMFELTRNEIMSISQSVISLKFSKRVTAFTEYGIVMLSSILNSELAINVNIQIVKAFIKLKNMLNNYKDLKLKIDKLEEKYDEQFKIVFQTLRQMLDLKQQSKKQPMGFKIN